VKEVLRQLEEQLGQRRKALRKLNRALRRQKKTLRRIVTDDSSTETHPLETNPTPTQRRRAMAATTKSIRRPTVTLQLPKSVTALIVYAQGIVERADRTPQTQYRRDDIRRAMDVP